MSRLKIDNGFLLCTVFSKEYQEVEAVHICSSKEAYKEFQEKYKHDIKDPEDERTGLFTAYYEYTKEDFEKRMDFDEFWEECYNDYIDTGTLPFNVDQIHHEGFPLRTHTFKHIWVTIIKIGSFILDNLTKEEKLILLEYLKIQIENGII